MCQAYTACSASCIAAVCPVVYDATLEGNYNHKEPFLRLVSMLKPSQYTWYVI